MTPERIAELRALCQAATPGPWATRRYAAARTALHEALDEIERLRRELAEQALAAMREAAAVRKEREAAEQLCVALWDNAWDFMDYAPFDEHQQQVEVMRKRHDDT